VHVELFGILFLKPILLEDSILDSCYITSYKSLRISLKIAEQYCALSFLNYRTRITQLLIMFYGSTFYRDTVYNELFGSSARDRHA